MIVKAKNPHGDWMDIYLGGVEFALRQRDLPPPRELVQLAIDRVERLAELRELGYDDPYRQ
jgi:hypothetical protein